MKAVPPTLLLFFGLTNAVDLFLWKNPNSCRGGGTVCPNIPEETCCSDGDLFGSGEAKYPPKGMISVTQLFAHRNGLDCGINLGPVSRIPFCISTGLDLTVSGIAWEFQSGSKKRDEMNIKCKSVAEGHPAYREGKTVWVISKEKMARENLKKPDNDAELAAFFKTHADRVMKEDTTAPVVQVNVAEGNGTAAEGNETAAEGNETAAESR